MSWSHVKTWLKRLLLALAALIALEQCFIFFYLDNAAIHDDAAFTQYLSSLGPPKYPGKYKPWDCAMAKIAVIYSFRMCMYDWSGEARDMSTFVLQIAKPAGYFTLIPWDYEDRILFDGAFIYKLDSRLNIIHDFRKS